MVLDSAFRVPRSAFPWLFALCALLLPLALAGPTEGGSISLTTQVTVSVTGERIHGLVTVTNGGNVPAHRVRLDITLPGARLRLPGEQTLQSAQSGQFPFEARLGMIRRGTHPLRLTVHFQDSVGHPFSAISASTFLVKKDEETELLARGEPLMLEDRGILRIRIENTAPTAKTVTASLFLPREIDSAAPIVESTVYPRSRKELLFPVANLSALSGATYPVFCLVEYDLGESHYTLVSMTTLHVTGGGNWFRETRWFWAGGMLLLVMGFCASRIILGRHENHRTT